MARLEGVQIAKCRISQGTAEALGMLNLPPTSVSLVRSNRLSGCAVLMATFYNYVLDLLQSSLSVHLQSCASLQGSVRIQSPCWCRKKIRYLALSKQTQSKSQRTLEMQLLDVFFY